MLRRSGIYALKALLELALDPPRWQSVNALALAQDLPAPMLEQLMLKLRRAALVESRRGRQGGYRLLRLPADLPLAAILAAVDAPTASLVAATEPEEDPQPSDRVTRVLNRRLLQALERELDRLTLEDLLFDLRSAQAAFSESGGLLLG
jgi:Rrf2 family protein